MKPKQIKIVDKDKLSLVWNDDSISLLTLKYLRDECPCAGCKGETILFTTFRPPKPTILSTEMYKIKSIDVIGDYAIQIGWKDGHNTGIYSWEYLKILEDGESSSDKQKYDTLI
ncbi:MAG TPA: DUF971 domain-containing protein [Ignavibacteriaceae bacterium]|nr:DUF971 domain-containing protein [Ignavibacterium sp.]HMN25436.1 DUF971 domain-containing protein [Ignavibacteriaceae bacterium]